MRKFYVIEKVTGTLQVSDDPENIAIYMWGRNVSQYILIVANDNGTCIIPLTMLDGSAECIKDILEAFDDI